MKCGCVAMEWDMSTVVTGTGVKCGCVAMERDLSTVVTGTGVKCGCVAMERDMSTVVTGTGVKCGCVAMEWDMSTVVIGGTVNDCDGNEILPFLKVSTTTTNNLRDTWLPASAASRIKFGCVVLVGDLTSGHSQDKMLPFFVRCVFRG